MLESDVSFASPWLYDLATFSVFVGLSKNTSFSGICYQTQLGSEKLRCSKFCRSRLAEMNQCQLQKTLNAM